VQHYWALLPQDTHQTPQKWQYVPAAFFTEVNDAHPCLGEFGLIGTASKKHCHSNSVASIRQTLGQHDQLALRATTNKRTRKEQDGFRD
jgi:hypothetical protein